MDSWFELLAVERPPPDDRPARRQARPGAGDRRALPRRRGRRARRGALRPGLRRARAARRRSTTARSTRRTALVHLPAALAERVRRLALGGAPPARPGRRAGSDGEPLGGRRPGPADRPRRRGRRPARAAPVPPAAGALMGVHAGLLRLQTDGHGEIVDLTEGVAHDRRALRRALGRRRRLRGRLDGRGHDDGVRAGRRERPPGAARAPRARSPASTGTTSSTPTRTPHAHLRAAMVGPVGDAADRRRASSGWGPGSRSCCWTSTTARASASSRCTSCPESRRPCRRRSCYCSVSGQPASRKRSR